MSIRLRTTNGRNKFRHSYFSVKSRIFGYILYLLESWAMLKDPAVHQAAAGSLAHKIGKGGKSSKGGFHLAGFSTAPPAHRERFA